MLRIILALAGAFSLVGSLALAEISAAQVAGKTLQAGKSVFVVAENGSLTGTTEKGDALSGSWQVKDGQWCRTIKTPERLAGTACQAASIKGKTFTLTRADGSTIKFKMK